MTRGHSWGCAHATMTGVHEERWHGRPARVSAGNQLHGFENGASHFRLHTLRSRMLECGISWLLPQALRIRRGKWNVILLLAPGDWCPSR